MTYDELIERIQTELPGFSWNISQGATQASCTLTSPDFKSEVWEAGGETREDIECGVRVYYRALNAKNAILGAIKVAKDKLARREKDDSA